MRPYPTTSASCQALQGSFTEGPSSVPLLGSRQTLLAVWVASCEGWAWAVLGTSSLGLPSGRAGRKVEAGGGLPVGCPARTTGLMVPFEVLGIFSDVMAWGLQPFRNKTRFPLLRSQFERHSCRGPACLLWEEVMEGDRPASQ